MILALPNEGLCRRCHDKIEWRKKYRKYKPLRQPAVCQFCHLKEVKAAYHRSCGGCAAAKAVCPFCCLTWKEIANNDFASAAAAGIVDKKAGKPRGAAKPEGEEDEEDEDEDDDEEDEEDEEEDGDEDEDSTGADAVNWGVVTSIALEVLPP